jgi:hypothetical protein
MTRLVILSTSNGRKNDSTIAIYTDPREDGNVKSHQVVNTRNGQPMPLRFLGGKNRVEEVDYLPTVEKTFSNSGGNLVDSGARSLHLRGQISASAANRIANQSQEETDDTAYPS